MTKTGLNIDKNTLKALFDDSDELLVIIDKDKNIVYLNRKASSLFQNSFQLSDVEHLFSFDVCILNSENIMVYNPLQEALLAQEVLKAEVLFQSGENEYRKYLLKSFKNSGNTIIILSETLSQAENQTEKPVDDSARKLAVRTGLINRISTSIRQSLELNRIIEIALEEISTSLGIDKGYFAEYQPPEDELTLKNNWNMPEVPDLNNDSGIRQAISEQRSVVSMIMTDMDSNRIQPRLVTPVIYKDKIQGMLAFYHINNTRTWHEEEISLIEGLASQLAVAINQAEMLETAIKQKRELEQTLLKLKETQAQLIQSEKMASLGQLVAGVAHEINTPLGSINSNNGILAKCLDKIGKELKDNDILDIVNEAISTNTEAIRRINGLVKSLKNFARLDEAEYQETDIHEGIKSTLLLINHEIKDRIKVIVEFGRLPAVKCYPNALNQVFMNVLINACQSIEGNGKITIKTEAQGEKVIITISDTGKGISKENLPRIFDPGFTTKGVGVGSGLGLSICYKIMEQHKGTITVESEERKGTTFKITLYTDFNK